MLQKLTIIISIFIGFYINYKIYIDKYSNLLISLWLLIIILIIFPFIKKTFKNLSLNLNKTTFFIFFLMLLPLIIRGLNYDIENIHADEFISAHISESLDLKNLNFFSSTPPGWVCQFPLPYFVLQKLFFNLFKITPNLIRFSTLPYVFIISFFLYLIVKNILGKKPAYIALIFYSFFAPSLYLETFGLHFVSSTALFLAFFYFLIKSFQINKLSYYTITGILMAFCYLTYYSSYLALPIFLLFTITIYLTNRKLMIFKKAIWTLFIFTLIVSPFFVHAFKYNNYFTQRYNQINLISGEWGNTKNSIDPLYKIKDNFTNAIFSIYHNNIGGHGGYDFGKLALLERTTLGLFILGLLIPFKKILDKNNIYIIFIKIFILISFITGMVLTLPPPAFHRFSIAFPFIIIITCLPIKLIIKLSKSKPKKSHIIIVLIIIIFTSQNYIYFQHMKRQDIINNREDLEDVKVIKYIERNYPEHQVYIAAFPTFALKKVYYFYNPSRKIIIENHQQLIENFNKKENYVYVILFPEEFRNNFKELDPSGKLNSSISWKYDIFVNNYSN